MAQPIKPCVSAPSCSTHKHRPQPKPCPDPDKCYKACIKRKTKCPSAMDTVRRTGSPCDCSRVQSKDMVSRRKGRKKHKKRMKKIMRTNSMESRWTRRKKGCCVVL